MNNIPSSMLRKMHKEMMKKIKISKHAGKRMFERKIHKKLIASAILHGVKTEDKNRICSIHRDKKYVYKIVNEQYHIITVMPYW